MSHIAYRKSHIKRVCPQPSISSRTRARHSGSTATSHQHWYPIFTPHLTSLRVFFNPLSALFTTLSKPYRTRQDSQGSVILSRLFCCLPNLTASVHTKPSARLGKEPSLCQNPTNPPSSPPQSARKHHNPPKMVRTTPLPPADLQHSMQLV